MEKENLYFDICLLFVEDDEMISTFAKKILTPLVKKILFAKNGKEGLEMYIQNSPDIVITDIGMPVMDGLIMAEKIRFLYNQAQIIVTTSRNDINLLLKAFELDLNHYVIKPYEVKKIIEAVKKSYISIISEQRLQKYYNELEAKVKERTNELEKLSEEIVATNKALSRFVPNDFLKFLNKENITQINLGDNIRQEMTIFFSDIREFTSLSETMTPEDNFKFINAYLKRMVPIIRQNSGIIDKYIGDSILALFSNITDNALQAAIETQKEVSKYNLHRLKNNRKAVVVGIGIHTGELMLGVVGDEERLENTVISDTVNIASRIEGLTKLYDARVIISEKTLKNLSNPENYSFRYLDRVKVKGKSTAISVFEVFSSVDNSNVELKIKTISDFEKAIELYQLKNIHEAYPIFKKIHKINHLDVATNIYIQRCENILKYGLPADWDGIEAIKVK